MAKHICVNNKKMLELVSKGLAGVKDDYGRNVHFGDVVKYFEGLYSNNSHNLFGTTTFGIVKFGYFEQDGSGGEYLPTRVLGVYIQNVFKVEKYSHDINYNVSKISKDGYDSTISLASLQLRPKNNSLIILNNIQLPHNNDFLNKTMRDLINGRHEIPERG